MSISGYFNGKSRFFFITAGTALVIVISIPDYLLPHSISFSIFYLIPVSAASWYAGKEVGIYMSVISAILWFAADILTANPYERPYVPYWNALVRLGFFLVVVLLVIGLKREKLYASEDYLTGLSSRRHFFEVAEKEVRRSQRYGRPFTIAYIDIDDFKSINDRFGHAEGDRILKSAAHVIKRSVRVTDVEARLGGDEFAVLLPESDPESASKFFKELHRKLGGIRLKHKLPASFSIGVVTYVQAPMSVDKMIMTADDLMYSAKKSGKNLVKHRVIGVSDMKTKQPQ